MTGALLDLDSLGPADDVRSFWLMSTLTNGFMSKMKGHGT